MAQDRTRADAIADGSIHIPVNDAMGGGMLAAFVDSVLGGAAALHLSPERYPALAEMKISIFRPADAGTEIPADTP
ncbi:MAG: hypothetical protein ABI571_04585 [Actinomycetota bacterium]